MDSGYPEKAETDGLAVRPEGSSGDLADRSPHADSGVQQLPAAGSGVGVGDSAGALPSSPDLEGFDYWDVHPARGAITRVHVEWRRDLFEPDTWPEGVASKDVQTKRITQKEFADGTMDIVEDEWGVTPRGTGDSKPKATRRTKDAWRGTPW